MWIQYMRLCLSSKYVILSTWRKKIALSRFFSETDRGHDLNMNLSMYSLCALEHVKWLPPDTFFSFIF